MASEGIELNPLPGSVPTDPYAESRKEKSAIEAFTTPSTFDKLKQFLELDRKVGLHLSFTQTKLKQVSGINLELK